MVNHCVEKLAVAPPKGMSDRLSQFDSTFVSGGRWSYMLVPVRKLVISCILIMGCPFHQGSRSIVA